MCKKRININFDYLQCWNITNIIKILLSNKYELIISDKPDIVFYSVRNHNHYKWNNCVKIEIIGESDAVDFPYTDYSISMDKNTYNNKNCYCPLFVIYHIMNSYNNFPNNIKYNKSFLMCGCISNKYYYGAHVRFNSFNYISNKLGLTDNNLSGKIGNSLQDKHNALKQYKFNFCFENKCQCGYLTEKIADAYESGCIPVYRGDSMVTEIFNEKSFINGNNLTDDEIVDKINEINNNEELYQAMLNEPILVNPNYIDEKIKEVKEFLYNICDKYSY